MSEPSTAVGEPIRIFNPVTGANLQLDAPLEDLGAYLAEIREYESYLREAKALVSREVMDRMKRRGKWTLPAGDYELTAPRSDTTEQWDGITLRSRLLELVDKGMLDVEAVDEAVEFVPEYKVKKRGVQALRATAAADIVNELAEVVPVQRRVTVSRG